MTDYTNETEGCARDVVYAVDYLDEEHDLLGEAIPLDATLGDCGHGGVKCAILESWVNRKRAQAGKGPLEDPLTPETTIAEVIENVCS